MLPMLVQAAGLGVVVVVVLLLPLVGCCIEDDDLKGAAAVGGGSLGCNNGESSFASLFIETLASLLKSAKIQGCPRS